MPLYFIAGTAGTGKSRVCLELKAKGYEAYDVDVDGFAKWQNLVTGYVHPKSSISAVDRTPEFLSTHGWHVPRKDVEALHAQAAGKLIFLCGDIGNESELHEIFDGIFALYVDDETLKHRLATRTDNDWGKQPHELMRSLEKHHKSYDNYRDLGATIIDATKPIEQVVEDILSEVSGEAIPE
jgi:dephospho-CoA kinase